MRKTALGIIVLLALLTGCGGEGTEERTAQVREAYAAHPAYSAAAEVEIAREDETLRYTLRVDAQEEETAVTVLAPELLAGTCAHLRGDALRLEYDGLILDAGSAAEGLSAVNCIPLTLRAVAEGYLLAQSVETLDDVEGALRLSVESEAGGGTLCYAVWFDADGAPLYAEIQEKEEIAAFIRFTNFAFCDILPSEENS